MPKFYNTFYILILFLSYGCNANEIPSRENQEKTLTDLEIAMQASLLNTALTVEISQTSEIKNTTDHSLKEEGLSRFTVSAEKLADITGISPEQLTINFYVDSGEEISLPEVPFIISICEDGDDFYWPGVGAVISNQTNIKQAIDNVKTRITANKSWCE